MTRRPLWLLSSARTIQSYFWTPALILTFPRKEPRERRRPSLFWSSWTSTVSDPGNTAVDAAAPVTGPRALLSRGGRTVIPPRRRFKKHTDSVTRRCANSANLPNKGRTCATDAPVGWFWGETPGLIDSTRGKQSINMPIALEDPIILSLGFFDHKMYGLFYTAMPCCACTQPRWPEDRVSREERWDVPHEAPRESHRVKAAARSPHLSPSDLQPSCGLLKWFGESEIKADLRKKCREDAVLSTHAELRHTVVAFVSGLC